MGRDCGHGRPHYLAARMHSTYGVYVLADVFDLSQLLFLNNVYVLGYVCSKWRDGYMPTLQAARGNRHLSRVVPSRDRNTEHGLGGRLGNVVSELVAIAKDHCLGVPGCVPDEFPEWERLAPACVQLMESMYWSMSLV